MGAVVMGVSIAARRRRGSDRSSSPISSFSPRCSAANAAAVARDASLPPTGSCARQSPTLERRLRRRHRPDHRAQGRRRGSGRQRSPSSNAGTNHHGVTSLAQRPTCRPTRRQRHCGPLRALRIVGAIQGRYRRRCARGVVVDRRRAFVVVVDHVPVGADTRRAAGAAPTSTPACGSGPRPCEPRELRHGVDRMFLAAPYIVVDQNAFRDPMLLGPALKHARDTGARLLVIDAAMLEMTKHPDRWESTMRQSLAPFAACPELVALGRGVPDLMKQERVDERLD